MAEQAATFFNFGCCMACRAPLLPADTTLNRRECLRVYLINTRFAEIVGGKQAPVSEFTDSIEMFHIIPISKRHEAIRFIWNCMHANDAKIPIEFFEPSADNSKFSDLNATQSFEFKPVTQQAATWKARWQTPDTAIPLESLVALLIGEANGEVPPDINLDLKYPTCSCCNDLVDVPARLCWMCDDRLVPRDAISIFKPDDSAADSAPKLNSKPFNNQCLAPLLAYYLHRCTLNLRGRGIRNNTSELNTPASAQVRRIFITICFLLLNLVALWQERAHRVGGTAPRHGLHTYDGLMNLITGHICFLIFSMKAANRAKTDFSRFYLLYISELVDAPESIWEQDHTRLYQPLFEELTPDTPVATLITIVANNLVAFYITLVKPIGNYLIGAGIPKRISPKDAKFYEDLKAFFVTREEADKLLARHDYCGRFSSARSKQNIAPYIQHVGGFAILWPILRSFVVEDARYRQLIYRWLEVERGIECDAMIRHNPNIKAFNEGLPKHTRDKNALALFNLMFLLYPEKIIGETPFHQAIDRWESSFLQTAARAQPFCSIWKATIRHGQIDCIGEPWVPRLHPTGAMRAFFRSLPPSALLHRQRDSPALRGSAHGGCRLGSLSLPLGGPRRSSAVPAAWR